MQLSTGVQFWATRKNPRVTEVQRLWTVVEPSMGKTGWLCRTSDPKRTDGTLTVHSDELENMEPANG